jgi:hypothetical protein
MLKVTLGLLLVGASLSTYAAENEAPEPPQEVMKLSPKQQVIKAFEQSCELREEAQCGCIAETMVPALSDSKVTVILSQLDSGEVTHKNLIPRNQVEYNRAQKKCAGN